MMWLSWRQHRIQAASTTVLAAGLVGVLLLVGRTVHSTFTETGLNSCLARNPAAACEAAERVFDARHSSVQFILILVLFFPLLVGAFWGAPLVAREIEHGTHRFAWTQGVSRLRWLTPKLVLGIAATSGCAIAVTAASSWLAHPFNEVFSARLSYGVFDVQGIVPIAYTLFAFAIGLTAGTVTRRVLPSMALTVGVFIVLRAVVEFLVRPRLLPTQIVSYPTETGRPPSLRGAFVVAERVVTSTGEEFSRGFDIMIGPSTVGRWCPDMATVELPPIETIDACISRLGLRTIETVHPASQYWTLQFLEAGMFLAATIALLTYAVWRVRRRLGA